MSKNTKTCFAAYTAWNVEMEELTLNRQSERGWQLQKGGCFHTVFKADDSIRFVHKIDYNPDMTANSEEKGRYIDIFAQQGWEYINSTYNGWHYFRKVYDASLPISEYEIYTDSDSYEKMMRRWIKLGRMVQIMELLIGFQNLIIGIGVDSGSNLALAFIPLGLVIWLQNGISKIKARF